MQIIIVKSKDLTHESRRVETRICAVSKKRKETDKALLKIAKEYGVDEQWNLLRDSGTGVAGGFERSFLIKDMTEGVLYLNDAPLEEMK